MGMVPERYGGEAVRCRESAGCRRNWNGRRIAMRLPNDRRFIRPQIRIDRETLAPNVESAAQEAPLGCEHRRRSPRSRAGNQDCGGGTPKPVQPD